MKGKHSRIVLLVIMLLFIGAFFLFDLGQYLNLDYLKARQTDLDNYYHAHPLKTSLIFFCIYVVLTGLSLPAAGIMTLAGGAIFGLLWGTVLASFASVLGATLAFLASRFLFRDIVQSRFSSYLIIVNNGIHKDGAFYLFTMRLIPIFPFFIINAVMGLTAMRTFTFAGVSQIGMLVPTMIFVNAGTQLAKIEKIGDILSPEIITSFALLGLFPLLARKAIIWIRARRSQEPSAIPDDFDEES